MTVTGRELVLGIQRARIMGGATWRGILHGPIRPLLDLIESEGEFRPRDEVESDPGWKQVIPYVVLRSGERFFLMRRTRAGSDARLHERYSIGIGGHVNPGDGGVAGGLRREWKEELIADWRPDFAPVGLLNDDTDPVGRVHLGIVFMTEAQGPVAVRETHKLEGSFAEPAEVLAAYNHMETWSSLLLDYLTGRAPGVHFEGGFSSNAAAAPAGESRMIPGGTKQ